MNVFPSPQSELDIMLAYVQGKLDATQRAEVERKRDEDELFAFALAELAEGLKENPQMGDTLKAEMPAFQKRIWDAADQMERRAVKVEPLYGAFQRYGLLAASVLLIALAIWWFGKDFTGKGSLSPQELAQVELAEWPFEQTLSTLSASDPTDSLLNLAIPLHQSGRYTEAIPLWEALLPMTEDAPPHKQSEVRLCAAYSYLHSGQIQAAILLLQAELAFAESQYHQEANWFLGLAYLHQEQLGPARTCLEKAIQAGGTRLPPRARSLLDQIEKTFLVR